MAPNETAKDDWIAFLKGTEVFRGVPEEAVWFVGQSVTEISLEAGAALFHQGDAADAMFVIREGRLKVLVEEKGHEPRALTMLEAGQCVGEGALIMAGGRSATVRASTPSRLLRMSAAAFERAMSVHPELRHVLSPLVAARLPGLIDASLRSELRTEMTWVRLERGEVLFRAGDPGDAVYVVARGRVGGFSRGRGGRGAGGGDRGRRDGR